MKVLLNNWGCSNCLPKEVMLSQKESCMPVRGISQFFDLWEANPASLGTVQDRPGVYVQVLALLWDLDHYREKGPLCWKQRYLSASPDKGTDTQRAPGLCSPRWWLNSVLQGESFQPLRQSHLSVSAEDYVKSASAPFDDRHWRKGEGLEILSLPTAAFIKHFVNRCHNTTFHCSCTKGSHGPRTIEPCSRNSSGSSVER